MKKTDILDSASDNFHIGLPYRLLNVDKSIILTLRMQSTTISMPLDHNEINDF